MVSLNSMIRAAKKSKHHRMLHACLIFRGGAVVSVENNDENLHAEIRALNKTVVKKNLTLLSIRVGKSGELRNARPCKKCWEYILMHDVRMVLFSNEEGRIERIKMKRR